MALPRTLVEACENGELEVDELPSKLASVTQLGYLKMGEYVPRETLALLFQI